MFLGSLLCLVGFIQALCVNVLSDPGLFSSSWIAEPNSSLVNYEYAPQDSEYLGRVFVVNESPIADRFVLFYQGQNPKDANYLNITLSLWSKDPFPANTSCRLGDFVLNMNNTIQGWTNITTALPIRNNGEFGLAFECDTSLIKRDFWIVLDGVWIEACTEDDYEMSVNLIIMISLLALFLMVLVFVAICFKKSQSKIKFHPLVEI